jgi:sugar lactone lactonase YvrE
MISKNYRVSSVLSAASLVAACALFAGCGGSGGGGIPVGPTPPPSNGSMYITDSSGAGDQILVFPESANGGPAPTQQITGTSTGLSIPLGVAVDSAGNIWVTNSNTSSITEYAPGSNGNQAPINTVIGNATGLSQPIGIWIDSSQHVWVANFGNNSVTEYGPNPSGNQAPIATIAGAATTLNQPAYLTVDTNGNVYVTNFNGNNIAIYAPGASGNAAPFVSFGGNCFSPAGIALDASGHIYASCQADYTVREYTALNGTSRPTQIRGLGIMSANPNLYNPSGIAVNSLGTLFVANTGIVGNAFGYITVYGPNYNNASLPGATVGGGNSFLIRPAGIAVH